MTEHMYSESINNLINEFKKLPTVGQKTAERFVFKLLKSGKKQVGELTLALKKMSETVKSCEKCWDFSDSNPCKICLNQERDNKILCLVAESQDKQAIEKTNEYRGLYFIMRGVIKLDQENLNYIKIRQLIVRLEQDINIEEILLAFNPDMNGETTMLYLEKQIKKSA